MIMTHEEIIILAKEAGIIDPSPYVGARENQLLALERFALLVVADFLQRTGQYVTNDASREAAINAAHIAEQRAMRERVGTLCDELEQHWSDYKDTALINGNVALSNAASGEPRAARAIKAAVLMMEVKPS